MTTWKQIPGFSKRYFAGSNGELKTTAWKGSNIERVLKPAKDAKGYLRTMLVDESGRTKTIKVHRIIALAFLGESDLMVNHKDGNKTNNAIENLEYCTNRQNIIHAYANGMIKTNKGEKHHRSILKRVPIKQLLSDYKELGQIKLVAIKHGMDRHAVSRALKAAQ